MKEIGRSAVVRFVCVVAFLSLAPAYSSGAMMEEVRMGMLSSFEGHHASGKVSIVKQEKGNLVLTLTDIKVDKVPDGRVYLAKGGDYTKGIEIGLLKKFTGTVEFPIPAGTNLDEYDSVVIWCKKFNVGIGRAYFEKERMMEDKGMMKEKGTMKQ